MKKKVLIVLFVALVLFVGQAYAARPVGYSERTVTGHSKGNHDLDCTIIRPWNNSSGPGDSRYPVIVWANGWGQGNEHGANITDGYKPGLIEWALDGPYIVIAANQWSAQESDVLACLQWIFDQNDTAGSQYQGVVNTAKTGLAGHSQGGGAVVKAGNGEPNGFDITSVITMNPYGPGWVDAGDQDGPVMVITGSEDLNTPLSWTYPVFEAVQTNGIGGLFAELIGGDHSRDAWGPEGEDPTEYNFGRYQEVSELWWQFTLKDDAIAGRKLKRILDKDPWDTQYAFTEVFDLYPHH